MHDPMTVAFDIHYPWPWKRHGGEWPGGNPPRPTFITVWHIDPERRYRGIGSADDSCDWSGFYRPLSERDMAIVEALCALETTVGNSPIYGSEMYRVEYDDVEHGNRIVHGRLGKDFEAMQEAIRLWRKRERYWWQHPRWHVWHWRIQIHPVQQFKRWAFSRCAECGERFAFGEAPVSGSWYGTGPLWFRGEKNIRHSRCRGGPAAPAERR